MGATACGASDDDADASGRPHVVATTSIVGDLVSALVGDEADVDVILPAGADPHEFAPSARQAEAMADADLLVVNGAGFEQGLTDVIDAAREDGTPTFAITDHVVLRTRDGAEHDGDHEDEGGVDPHVWTDPLTLVDAVGPLADALTALDGIDAAPITRNATELEAALHELDAEIDATLAAIPPARRVLVTNHEALGYFAARYRFEVVGSVIPSLSTASAGSAAELEELARVIEEHHVPAIFAETTQPTKLAEALADDVDVEVDVVPLYTESLGEEGSGADTYVGMMRTNAERIVEALA
jgi:zinc/manganese transport system substrate-binding protein